MAGEGAELPKKFLKKGFAVGTDIINLLGEIRDQVGVLEDEVVVTVSGNHQSKKNSLYFLAAAVGFGIINRLVPAGGAAAGNPFPSPGLVGIEYDATTKEVTFILRYRQNVLTILTVGAGKAALSGVPVFSGPLDIPTGNPDAVTGGAWDFTLGSVVALPTPTLPNTDRVILTDSPTIVTAPGAGHPNPATVVPAGTRVTTPNPRPVGDARSRGQLTWMVWQSLANPCESLDGSGTVVYNPPTNANRFTGG